MAYAHALEYHALLHIALCTNCTFHLLEYAMRINRKSLARQKNLSPWPTYHGIITFIYLRSLLYYWYHAVIPLMEFCQVIWMSAVGANMGNLDAQDRCAAVPHFEGTALENHCNCERRRCKHHAL